MIGKAKFVAKEAVLRLKYMTTKDCLFCKIIEGQIKSKRLIETELTVAISDVNPVAQIHILIIPKKHIDSVLKITDDEGGDIIDMYKVARNLVEERKLESFRLAFNGGKFQHIPHLHMHLLAGGSVNWKKL
jgi:histidine triad (HIT) family protein